VTLTRTELERVLEGVGPWVRGAAIQQVRAPDRERVYLSVRRPGETRWLLLCAARGLGRLHYVERPPPNPRESLAFQGLLRKELGGVVTQVDRLAGERIVRLTTQRGGVERSLVLEVYGAGGNIVLLDEEDRVLGRAGPARRPGSAARRGEPWVGPEGEGAWVPVEGAGTHGADDVSAELAHRYAAREEDEAVKARLRDAQSRLRGRRKEIQRRLKRQERDLERSGDPEVHRRRASLLQGSFHRMERGRSEVEVTDWEAEGQPTLMLAVDPSREPKEIVAAAFARARRAERARDEAGQRIAESRSALDEVETLLELLGTDPDEAIPLVDELLPTRARQAAARRAAGPRLPYLAFRAPSGHEIRVGRRSRDNDELTFRHSKGNDVWLHARGRPGAHVVIRGPGPSPSPELLIPAAQLALLHSGMKEGDRGEVTWTRVKHVSKPKGSKPGSVVPTQDKVLYVEIEPETLAKLERIEG